MDKKAEWVEDMLGAIKDSGSRSAVRLIESCGQNCAKRKHFIDNIESLKAKLVIVRAFTNMFHF